MKFLNNNFLNKTALQLALQNDNDDIVKLLLNRDDIDVNISSILIFYYFNKDSYSIEYKYI